MSQDWKVVTLRAAHHLCPRRSSASLKRAHFGTTPRPAQAEHPELGLGKIRTLQTADHPVDTPPAPDFDKPLLKVTPAEHAVAFPCHRGSAVLV